MTEHLASEVRLSVGRQLALNALLALAYFLFGKLGLALALPPGYVSALWPAAGVAFAAALVWRGRCVWPGIFMGSLLTNATIGGGFAINGVVIGIAAGSALQAVVGAYWLRRSNPSLRLDSPARVLKFSLLGVLSCLIAASVGNLTLLAHGLISLAQVPQSFLTWWLGDAFGVQIFAPLSLLVLAPNAAWKARRISVGLPLLLAFSLCGVIYFFVSQSEERQLIRDFTNKTATLRSELTSLDRIHGTALLQLAAMYRLNERVSAGQFQQMAADIRSRMPALGALEFVPLIDNADDARFAALARSVGLTAGALKYPPGFAPSADRRAAPVLQVYPVAGNEAAIGVDLRGEPIRRATIDAALASGKLAVTPVLRLAQDATGPGGVLLMAPVNSPAAQGVILGVLNLRLIDSMLEKLPGIVWELHLIDTGGGTGGGTRVAGNAPAPLPGFSGEAALDRAGVYLQQELALADRQWRFILHMPHARLVSEAGFASLLVLCLSLFSCGVFANFALIMSSDRERIRSEVAVKTQALQDEMAERRHFESALLESKRLLDEVVENSGLLIFIKSRDGAYQLINRKWESTVGLTREQTLNKTDLELFPGAVGQTFRDNDLAVMNSGIPTEKEEVLGEGEERRYFYSTKFPLRGASGEVTGICGMTTEITELKRYEAALEKARDAAQAANVAKSQFLATMSHEIRTPMNGILGMAQLLMMDGIDEPERKEYVRTILGSGQALMTILNDILDLSKVEAGKLELQTIAFDPSALLEETTTLFRETAQSKGLRLRADSSGADRRVIGDPLRLRQMLSNLVGNAIKFSDAGDVLLRLRQSVASDGRITLEFSVSDQGIGVAPDKQSRLFESFSQVDGSATRRFGGTGLGLSIVRRLAQLMDGDVGVESQEGVGSRFWFHVCLSAANDRTDTRRSERMALAPGAPDVIGTASIGRWILVAEDIATNRMVATSLLEKLGLRVRCALNGQEALALLAAYHDDPPGAILMDCQMPVIDGYAATAAIRERERNDDGRHVAIIALTADAFAEDRARCAAVGMDDFLAKPLVFDELVNALRRAGVLTQA